MKVRFKTMCRGDGKAYVLTEIADCAAGKYVGLRVLDNKGAVIPAELYPLAGESPVEAPQVDVCKDEPDLIVVRNWPHQQLIAVLPLLSVKAWNLEFLALNDERAVIATTAVSISAERLKWASRLNYRLHPSACAEIRDIDGAFAPIAPSLSFVRIVEMAEQVIVRMRCEFPYQGSGDPAFCVTDNHGTVVDVAPLVLEDASYGSAWSVGGRRRVMTVSFILPHRSRFACIQASDPERRWAPVFGMLDEASYYGLLGTIHDETMSAEHDPRYAEWYESHRATPCELAAQTGTAWIEAPCFSIVVPLYRTPVEFFRAMLHSVVSQSYETWELVLVNASPEDTALVDELERIVDPRIKIVTLEGNGGIAKNTNAGIRATTGDFVGFLDHDDLLAPDALFEYARAVREGRDVDLLYCDEDRFDASGMHSSPFFKPEFSLELLRAHNYITHFLAIRREVLDCVGLLDGDYDGAQDYDLVLRASETARAIVRVPRILYHWRMHEGSTSVNADSKSYARESGRAAVAAHLERCGLDASVEMTKLPFAYRAKYALPGHPSVSIIVPNKDKADLLLACVTSILEKSTYDAYEVLIVENNSEESETFELYRRLQEDSRVRVIVWSGEFNFSKIVNYAVAQTQSDYLLLLNNDTEVISPDFIETMLGYCQDDSVGVVGCKLLYQDRTVQHGGVVMGPFRSAGHLFTSLAEDDSGYFCRAVLPQDLSAVTGACQLIRRSIFDEVGGYSEEFVVGLNDVDFCLKIREAGYRVVYTPYAQLFHYEFSSRGRDREGARLARVEQELGLLRYRWPRYFVDGDPFTNPNIAGESQYFGLGE